MTSFEHDVVICGGGLAGLTLARQLRREVPEASVALVERSERPLPDACHKVGESSVELGSHYFENVLDLHDYLDEQHLYKNGLRFFVGDTQGPLAARVEVGPAGFPPIPSYQLDRGRLENDLRAMLEEAGVTLLEGWSVNDVDPGSGGTPHTVQIERGGETRTLTTRWVVDATGRRRLLQRKLGLGRPSPIASSSSWFRVRQRIDVAELVPEGETSWHSRDLEHKRWLSTNHLCGRGYWVWIIPLSTGFTSVGIVADGMHHDFSTFNTAERALDWIRTHEPRLAERLESVPQEDFRCIKDYAHLSARVFSPDRWSCVGEAGLFVDPLYSPGSDLIALANCFTTRLIREDLAGTLDPGWYDELNELYIGWAVDTGNMLRDHGETLARPSVFPAKVWFDFFHYWAFICQYFFQGIYRLSLEEHREFHAIGKRFFDVNSRAQQVIRAWAAVEDDRIVRDHVPLPGLESVLADRHGDLGHTKTPAETRATMEMVLDQTEDIVRELVLRAVQLLPEDRLETFAHEAGLEDWDCRIPQQRVALEAGRGSARRKQLGRVPRDMERALGRSPSAGESLPDRLRRASVSVTDS